MKKRLLSILLALAMITGLALAACGCSKDTDDPEETQTSISILMTINYPEKSGVAAIQDFKFNVEKDSTVLEAIELYGSLAEIPVLLDTTTNEIYGIGSVNNGQYNKNNTWQYQVNGKSYQKDPSNVKLKGGDSIVWNFTSKN